MLRIVISIFYVKHIQAEIKIGFKKGVINDRTALDKSAVRCCNRRRNRVGLFLDKKVSMITTLELFYFILSINK